MLRVATVIGAKHARDGEVDLAQEADLPACPCRAARSCAETPGICWRSRRFGEQARDVGALGLLDIEADVLDAFGDDRSRASRAGASRLSRDEHRDRCETGRRALPAGRRIPRDRLVEGAAPRRASRDCASCRVLRAVDADADIDARHSRNKSHHAGVDQHAVGLKRVPDHLKRGVTAFARSPRRPRDRAGSARQGVRRRARSRSLPERYSPMQTARLKSLATVVWEIKTCLNCCDPAGSSSCNRCCRRRSAG